MPNEEFEKCWDEVVDTIALTFDGDIKQIASDFYGAGRESLMSLVRERKGEIRRLESIIIKLKFKLEEQNNGK